MEQIPTKDPILKLARSMMNLSAYPNNPDYTANLPETICLLLSKGDLSANLTVFELYAVQHVLRDKFLNPEGHVIAPINWEQIVGNAKTLKQEETQRFLEKYLAKGDGRKTPEYNKELLEDIIGLFNEKADPIFIQSLHAIHSTLDNLINQQK